MISGQVLKELRESLNLTVEEVADKAGLPRSYLKEVEEGRRELSARNLLKLSEVLPLEDKMASSTAKGMVAAGLGDKVRALRRERGMTLKEMAASTGLSYTYLSEIERGNAVPSLSALRKLADAFGVPVSLFVNNERKSSLVGEKLKYVRTLRGLSQKELAARAGVSPGLIAQLETGKVQASLDTVEKIAAALGVSVCSLILERDEVEAVIGALSPELRDLLYDRQVQVILGSICTMNEENLRLVLDFIAMLNGRQTNVGR